MKMAVGGEAGGIVLTAGGAVGWAHNSVHLPFAFASSSSAPFWSLKRNG
jgi:hypothetical protein